jgi:hypothetical protein
MATMTSFSVWRATTIFRRCGARCPFWGDGADNLWGGPDNEEDVLISVNSTVTNNLTKLAQLRTDWTTTRSYNDRVSAFEAIFSTTTETNDGAIDKLYGGGERHVSVRRQRSARLGHTGKQAAGLAKPLQMCSHPPSCCAWWAIRRG